MDHSDVYVGMLVTAPGLEWSCNTVGVIYEVMSSPRPLYMRRYYPGAPSHPVLVSYLVKLQRVNRPPYKHNKEVAVHHLQPAACRIATGLEQLRIRVA